MDIFTFTRVVHPNNIIIFVDVDLIDRNLQVIGIYGCADPVEIHLGMTFLAYRLRTDQLRAIDRSIGVR